jgi:hypothetical protein
MQSLALIELLSKEGLFTTDSGERVARFSVLFALEVAPKEVTMKTYKLALIAAFLVGMTGAAFAAETANPAVDPNNDAAAANASGGSVTSSAPPLGVDISKAGTTKQERMAFFNKMSKDKQVGVQSRCTDALNNKGSGNESDIMVFCKDVMPQ